MYDKSATIFQRYIALTNQKPILAKRVAQKINQLIDENKMTEFTFVDIGSGDGVVTAPIVRSVKNRIALHTVCIEPSEDLALECTEMLGNDEVEYISSYIEDTFLPDADFVLMAHVLPYIKDISGVLGKVSRSLKAHGAGLIVINNKTSDDTLIKNETATQSDGLISSNIQQKLIDLGLRVSVECVESTIDAKGCKVMDEKGKDLISFFKHLSFEDIPTKEVEDIRSSVLTLMNSDGNLIKREDYIWFYR
jgi:ubiquinone/menaquinone biosynthesis C-methylase UbiE